jgi:hypothetical protein
MIKEMMAMRLYEWKITRAVRVEAYELFSCEENTKGITQKSLRCALDSTIER